MNTYKVKLTFHSDSERLFGASELQLDIVSTSPRSAILKAERTVPKKMMEMIHDSTIV